MPKTCAFHQNREMKHLRNDASVAIEFTVMLTGMLTVMLTVSNSLGSKQGTA
jgi:hypothetical protein